MKLRLARVHVISDIREIKLKVGPIKTNREQIVSPFIVVGLWLANDDRTIWLQAKYMLTKVRIHLFQQADVD